MYLMGTSLETDMPDITVKKPSEVLASLERFGLHLNADYIIEELAAGHTIIINLRLPSGDYDWGNVLILRPPNKAAILAEQKEKLKRERRAYWAKRKGKKNEAKRNERAA